MKPTQQKQFDKTLFQENVKRHLTATYATTVEHASARAWYLAMGRALAEFTTFDLLETEQDERILNSKSLNYLIAGVFDWPLNRQQLDQHGCV